MSTSNRWVTGTHRSGRMGFRWFGWSGLGRGSPRLQGAHGATGLGLGDERVADWTDSPTPPRNAERAPPRDGIGSSASPPQICRGGTEPPRQRPQQARHRLHHSLVSTRRQVDLPGSLPAEVERRASWPFGLRMSCRLTGRDSTSASQSSHPNEIPMCCAVGSCQRGTKCKTGKSVIFFLVFSWCLHHRSDPS